MSSVLTDEEKIECLSKDIIRYLINHPNYPKKKITSLKNKFLKKYKIAKTIKNSLILEYATSDELEIILPILRRRSTRSISGVTVVAVMTKPLDCPGKCIFCPGKNSQPGENAAQSYTGKEPAAIRSIMFDYDPYLQTKHRLMDQKAIGHNVDKVDLIIMGGTFLSSPINYQENFVKGCIDAMNNFYEPNFNDDIRSISLNEAKKNAVHSKLRFIGLTIETRPDYCTPNYIDRMLNYGGTRVEIGIQTLRDDILKYINRGHTTEDSILAIKSAKDGGMKVNAHMMPNLPNSTLKEDYEDFKNLFSNPDYRPDMLKIYPTLVVKGTKLFEMWKNGEYKPYSLEETIKLIAKIKSELPKYVRIQRIQRDIPAYLIEDGVKKSNLRQLVQNYLKEHGQKCNCIRCREQGFIHEYFKKQGDIHKIPFDDFKLHRIDYNASDGKEIFLSYENKNSLIGFLRLRQPSQDVFRPELKNRTMIVREIRVVGQLVRKGKKPTDEQIQHRGFGKNLLATAEKIAIEEFDSKKLAVISGIGVREYFYKQGYSLDGVYVSKNLQ